MYNSRDSRCQEVTRYSHNLNQGLCQTSARSAAGNFVKGTVSAVVAQILASENQPS